MGTFGICNFIAEKKKSTINIFYKESCTLVLGEFSSSPLSPGQQGVGSQNSQPLPFWFCAETLSSYASLHQFQPGWSSVFHH